jgi:hypothetical protein
MTLYISLDPDMLATAHCGGPLVLHHRKLVTLREPR